MRILAIILMLTLAAQAAEPRLEAAVEPATAPFGTTLKVVLDLSVPETEAFEPPAPESIKFGKFEVRDGVLTPLPPEEGLTRYRYTFRLAYYEPGTQTIPAVSLEVGEQTVESKPLEVELTGSTPLPNETPGEIRDLKPFQPIPIPPIVYLAGILAAGTLGALLWWAFKRLTQRPAAPPPPPLPPREWALKELDALADLPLEELVERLTEILRTYLARRYGIPVLERTTAELLTDLKQRDFSEELRRPVKSTLELGDLVKFAKVAPSREEALEEVQRTRQLIESESEATDEAG